MRYGTFLPAGGTIGFVAPSFGCNIEPYRSAFDHALETFEAMGYKTKEGSNCRLGKGIGISNVPEACARELMEAYCDQESQALISCGGGELMCETIGHVDFQRLREAQPKWFMGYSDNTNLTFLLTTLCDVASLYAPCAAAFGMEPWHPSLKDAFGVLTGTTRQVASYDLWERESKKDEEHPLLPYNVTEPVVVRSYAGPEYSGREPVRMSGRLLGGCMDCLVNLTGTQYDRVKEFCKKYEQDGIVWFLESCDLNVMAIRRAMWQMEKAGWFQGARGFIIGRPLAYGQELMGLDHYAAVLELLKPYGVPVIMDADVGHLAPMMPLVCGSLADVEAGDGRMKVSMRFE